MALVLFLQTVSFHPPSPDLLQKAERFPLADGVATLLLSSRQQECDLTATASPSRPASVGSMTDETGYLIDMDGVIYRENHVIPG